jgi:hypothetical protein
MAELLPLPKTDPRWPGLRWEPARPGAKKKDHDYSDRIVSDDSQFDIFKTADLSYLDNAKLKLHPVTPFKDYTKGVCIIDLEWKALDGGKATGDVRLDEIVAIGLKTVDGYDIGCNPNKTEKQLLQWLFSTLNSEEYSHIHTLSGYGIYGFFKGSNKVQVDLGMVYYRARANGVAGCPWQPVTTSYDTYRWANAIGSDGKPVTTPAWENAPGYNYEYVDLYPQTVSYDSLINKLPNYRLKTAVKGFGLREETRIEIGDQIHDYWARAKEGDKQALEDIIVYLKYDLDDSELLWNFLIPQKYFMKAYMPWSLQRITTTGIGSWWSQYLCELTGTRPTPYESCAYQGALTFYNAGYYLNVASFDFSGLYPSIEMTYDICSNKDPNRIFLLATKFLGDYRDEIKASEAFKRGDVDADGNQHTCKILRNGGYGSLGTPFLKMNDFFAASAVTAYSRNAARFMINFVYNEGCGIAGLDTDGIKLYKVNDNFKTQQERKAFFTDVCRRLNDALPGLLKVEYEADIPLLFIPPNLKDKNAAQKLADKLNSIDCYNVKASELKPGLSKNYFYFTESKDGSYKLTTKGKFKKRGKSWLQAGFMVELLTKLFYEGEQAAIDFAQEIRNQIAAGSLPVEKLRETLLIASNWKKFPGWGFEIGEKYTIHYTWRGDLEGKRVIKKVFVATEDINEPYGVEYYLEKFDEVMLETPITLPEPESEVNQLSLLVA